MRLQHRITIPFVVVVLLATSGVALVALEVTSRALRSRLQSQLEGALAFVSRSDFALNPVILQNVRAVIGAEVFTFGGQGEILASTAGGAATVLVDTVRTVVTERRPPDEGFVVSEDCGEPCMIAVRSVMGRPGVVVALVADTSELSAATRAVTRAIALGSIASAIVMMVVGHTVVRRVTAPLRRLIEFVRNVSPADGHSRAAVSDDEIGVLAEAFNGMLDRLQRSQDALVRSEKLGVAGLVAARVAHDIRNPLSSIKMQTQLLQARLGGDPEDRATLAAVLHDIDLVERVVRDLVETARPGELKREPISVNTVIRGALQQLAPQFAHRKVVVTTTFDADIPDVALDVARFQQALLNILVNASDAMPSGGEISVESRYEAGSVSIRICDEGTGIDPALADRVFDPFVSTKREGVGLGLVNARAVVEGHGGRISLSPRQPKGTCATITLPEKKPGLISGDDSVGN